jgi:hypothetical protein
MVAMCMWSLVHHSQPLGSRVPLPMRGHHLIIQHVVWHPETVLQFVCVFVEKQIGSRHRVMHTHTRIYMCICICTCTCTCIHIYIHTYITYIHTHIMHTLPAHRCTSHGVSVLISAQSCWNGFREPSSRVCSFAHALRVGQQWLPSRSCERC